MQKIKKLLAAGLALFTISNTVSVSALAVDTYGATAAAGDSTYSLEDMLTYAIEDEYLAYAEYTKILETYGSIRPFSNIIKAEQRHITALENLFAGLGMATPVNDAAVYVTTPASVAASLNAGILAEVNNIAMYEKFLAQDLPDAVVSVFTALKNASESHLAAFEKSLSGEGGGQARNGMSNKKGAGNSNRSSGGSGSIRYSMGTCIIG